MKAIVLAGGFATRLRPLTLTRPKSMLPILGKPLLDWILESLSRLDLEEVVISVRYLAEVIERRYSGKYVGKAPIKFAKETKPLGDAGPLKLVEQLYGLDTTFIVIYGDVFTDVCIESILAFHRKHGGIATLMLVEVSDPSRYGVAVLDDSYRIRSFVEKPRENPPSKLANAGIYVFEPEVLKFIPSVSFYRIARDLIPNILRYGDVYGYVYRGLWSDIGVPKDYLEANIEALRRFYPEGYVDPEAEIHSDVTIHHPVYIAKGCVVREGSVLGPNTIILEGVQIGPGTRIIDSLLFRDVVIEGYSYIECAIVSERVYIGKWVRIDRGSVIGDEVVISDGVHMPRETVVLPFKEISSSIDEPKKVIL
ncbi:MAG TPA: NDP-sugar synthase [Ignisphaera aggregans]|uniref:NDP-sugar synthase n=1 Tax=Ignisphaera aggregans TaxID=334771 RepID=A0A832YXG8_9CREN|nr:NDP-sugar synthase [Ignisphaera aggregans]